LFFFRDNKEKLQVKIVNFSQYMNIKERVDLRPSEPTFINNLPCRINVQINSNSSSDQSNVEIGAYLSYQFLGSLFEEYIFFLNTLFVRNILIAPYHVKRPLRVGIRVLHLFAQRKCKRIIEKSEN
jgi:hypothetical protein